MRFVIVGPGALGSVLGATLAEGGHQVVLLGRQSPHLDALRARGLVLISRNGESRQIAMQVTDDPAVVAGVDAIIVLVKSGDTVAAMQAIAPHIEECSLVLTLQNGLGNTAQIRRVLGRRARVLPGTTSQAATRVGPGEVVHAGEGPTLIGFLDLPDAPRAQEMARVLSVAGWPAAATPDIKRAIWHKVAVNAAINGLTALGGFANGMIASDPDLLDSAEIVAEEAASVARAKGIELGGMRRAVFDTAAATADNRSSMLQDIDAGRRTEVDAIHGALLAAGEESGVDTPAIRVVAALIRAKERILAKALENDD
jgi:2-dehydropantoate 2-reductase